jgi:hypothetical protein
MQHVRRSRDRSNAVPLGEGSTLIVSRTNGTTKHERIKWGLDVLWNPYFVAGMKTARTRSRNNYIIVAYTGRVIAAAGGRSWASISVSAI